MEPFAISTKNGIDSPDFALSLIERIKHLFTTENVSFLLLANRSSLLPIFHELLQDQRR